MSSLQCSQCNNQRVKLFILPCYSCHVLCEKCKECLERLPGSHEGRSDKKMCWLIGKHCQEEMHFVCPKCKEFENVFHIPEDSLTSVEDLSTEDLVKARKTVLRNLMEKKLKSFKKICGKSVVALEMLKKELNEHTQRCRISKIAGSSAGVVGGVMFIAGAILAPFTFGASTPLMIAGGITGGVGGGVVGGTIIAELLINKDAAKETQQLIENIQERYCRLIDHSNEYRIVDSFGKLVAPGITSGGLQVLSNSGMGVYRLVKMTGEFVSVVDARVTTVGNIVSVVAVVIDIIKMNGKELYSEESAKFSSQIEKSIAEINSISNMTMEELLIRHLE